MLSALWKGAKVTEDLDEFYPLRKDVDVTFASKYRPRKKKRLSEEMWQMALDSEGRWVEIDAVLDHIRRGGIDPHLRPEVWEFLLGVFDPKSTAQERASLRASRKEMYFNLKVECNLVDPVVGSGVVVDFPRVREDGSDIPVPANADNPMLSMLDMSRDHSDGDPPSLVQSSGRFVPVSPVQGADGSGAQGTYLKQFKETREEVLFRSGDEKIRKWRLGLHQIGVDVMRADRTLQFYEDEGNRARLMEVLALYSWFDSEVGYCQGMSDIMSPLVVLYDNNADAFWCFERIMRKIRSDFIGSSSSLGVQAEIMRLVETLKIWDADLFLHLDEIGASTLFFTVRSIMTLFRRELSFADALYLWEMQWAWEYDPEEAERVAKEDRRAIRSASKDPFKASNRDTFFQDEVMYEKNKLMNAARLAKAKGVAASLDRTPTAKGAPLLGGSPSRSAHSELPDEDSDKPASLPLFEDRGRMASCSGPEAVSGPLTASELQVAERIQAAYAKLTVRDDSDSEGEDEGSKDPEGKRQGAAGAADQAARNSGRDLESGSNGAGAGSHKRKGSRVLQMMSMPRGSLRKDQLLQALEYRRPGGKGPPRISESKSKAYGIKATLRRKLHPHKSIEGVGGKSGKTKRRGTGPGAEEEQQKLKSLESLHSHRMTRFNTFCVLAVLLHARDDLLECDGMDDVVDVYNAHAADWEVKDLCKSANEHKTNYNKMLN